MKTTSHLKCWIHLFACEFTCIRIYLERLKGNRDYDTQALSAPEIPPYKAKGALRKSMVWHLHAI